MTPLDAYKEALAEYLQLPHEKRTQEMFKSLTEMWYSLTQAERLEFAAPLPTHAAPRPCSRKLSAPVEYLSRLFTTKIPYEGCTLQTHDSFIARCVVAVEPDGVLISATERVAPGKFLSMNFFFVYDGETYEVTDNTYCVETEQMIKMPTGELAQLFYEKL